MTFIHFKKFGVLETRLIMTTTALGLMLALVVIGWLMHTSFKAGQKYNPFYQYEIDHVPACFDGYQVYRCEMQRNGTLKLVKMK